MKKTYVIKNISCEIDIYDVEKAHIDCMPWEKFQHNIPSYAQLARTENELVVKLCANEKNPLATKTMLGEYVHEDSCLEFFLMPDPRSDDRYLNFEFNSFGTLNLSVGTRVLNRVSFKNQDYKAFFRIKPFIQADKWGIDFVIPYSYIKSIFSGFDEKNMDMRGNFYKCGDLTAIKHFQCWNKISAPEPNFHISRYFGRLIAQ